jgi:hypothetical protein
MATQPNIEDFASVLNIPSARRAARNARDSSAPQIEQFGAPPGRPVATSEARRLAAEAVSANAIIHARLLAARDEVVGDPDYATLQARWDDAASRIVGDGLDRISHRGLRERVQTDLVPTLAKERAAIANHASRSAAGQHAANRDTMLRNLLQRQSSDRNDALLGGGTDAYHAMIDDAVGRGYLSADEALAEKRRGALALCEGECAAMARRDPVRATRELQGEADGHPLLAHLAPESKDALIRQAHLRLVAIGLDADLADMRQQQRERRASDEAESAIVADLFGDSPSVTANAILDNTALSEDARQRMLGAVARQNQPEPDAQVSQATTLALLDRIRRPNGDAQKITGIGPLVEAYNRGELSRADLRFAAKQLADARTPEGELLAHHWQGYIRDLEIDALAKSPHESSSAEHGAPEDNTTEAADRPGKPGETDIDDSQPNAPAAPSAETLDPLIQISANIARSWLYGLERDVDHRINRYRRDGKDPLDLFDPAKPDYVGKSAAMSMPQRNSLSSTA